MANELTWVEKSTGTAKPGIAAGKKMTGAEMEELRVEVNNRAAEINGLSAPAYNNKGAIKISRDSASSTTYISFDGSDTPNVT